MLSNSYEKNKKFWLAAWQSIHDLQVSPLKITSCTAIIQQKIDSLVTQKHIVH